MYIMYIFPTTSDAHHLRDHQCLLPVNLSERGLLALSLSLSLKFEILRSVFQGVFDRFCDDTAIIR